MLNNQSNTEPEDIFSEVDQSPIPVNSGIIRSTNQIAQNPPKKGKIRKYVLLFFCVIIIASAYFYYPQINIFFKSSKNIATNFITNFSFSSLIAKIKTNKTILPITNDQKIVEKDITILPLSTDAETAQKPASIDQDSDGLSDEEEANYGTNPNQVDTDHDGLTDREEVKIYHTNPLKPDTDGDGMTDGDEIKNFFDPNNSAPEAKLTDLQTAILELNRQ